MQPLFILLVLSPDARKFIAALVTVGHFGCAYMGLVKIHVFDEARCLRQDFVCDYSVLLSSMQ